MPASLKHSARPLCLSQLTGRQQCTHCQRHIRDKPLSLVTRRWMLRSQEPGARSAYWKSLLLRTSTRSPWILSGDTTSSNFKVQSVNLTHCVQASRNEVVGVETSSGIITVLLRTLNSNFQQCRLQYYQLASSPARQLLQASRVCAAVDILHAQGTARKQPIQPAPAPMT